MRNYRHVHSRKRLHLHGRRNNGDGRCRCREYGDGIGYGHNFNYFADYLPNGVKPSETDGSSVKSSGQAAVYSGPVVRFSKAGKSGTGITSSVSGRFRVGRKPSELGKAVAGMASPEAEENFSKPKANTGKFWLSIDKTKCAGCGLCARICPGSVFEIREEDNVGKKLLHSVIVNPEGCLYCGKCIAKCPHNAISPDLI